MKSKLDWYDVLDLFCWGIDTLGRPSISRALYGRDEEAFHPFDSTMWRRLQSQQWLVRRGRGANAKFTITPLGKRQCSTPDPRESWNRPWKGQWWLVTFDVPEARRHDRIALWRHLRAHGFGLLQRSVWILPRPMEAILQEIIHATGIPECFVGFECSKVFLCTDAEIVRTAWDLEALDRAHRGYLKQAGPLLVALTKAPNLSSLARAAREERLAYEGAMDRDPLFPRPLWPKGYLGSKVWEAHTKARSALRARFARLLPSEMRS